jgi:alpha-ribazole phosphatase
MNRPLQVPQRTLDFLRHGAPEGGDRYRGALDDPLSELGFTQMSSAVRPYLESPDRPCWHGVVTSPLRRCAVFAQTVAERLGVVMRIDPRLHEMSFGNWEGRTTAELLAQDREHLLAFWRDPWTCTPPGGETMEHFSQRIQRFLEDQQAVGTPGERWLVVTHGGVMRVVFALAMGMPLSHLSRVVVPYATLMRLRFDQVDDTVMTRLISFQPGGGV